MSLFYFQALQEAYSRCLSAISRLTEPHEIAVQVRGKNNEHLVKRMLQLEM